MQKQRGGAKIEVYNEVENNANDAATTGRKHYEPGHNMQMVRHIEEEKNVDRSDLIYIRV